MNHNHSMMTLSYTQPGDLARLKIIFYLATRSSWRFGITDRIEKLLLTQPKRGVDQNISYL